MEKIIILYQIFLLLMTRSRTALRDWEEIVATYQGIERRDEQITVHLEKNPSLSYPLSSPEASTLNEELRDVDTGTKIGILRTDDMSENPLLVRVEKENKDGSDSS